MNTVTKHAALISMRRGRKRVSCVCGWQDDWRDEVGQGRRAWQLHVQDTEAFERSLEQLQERAHG